MFAYDAVIYVRAKTAGAISSKLSKPLQTVAMWFQNAGLSINLRKTMSVCFASRFRSNTEEINLQMKGYKIEQVPEINYLGMFLFTNLNYTAISKKSVAKANLYTFRLIREYQPFHAAHTFLHSMILSHIRCCISSWSPSVIAIRPLQMIYNRADKIQDKKPIRSHHCISLINLKMLTFGEL